MARLSPDGSTLYLRLVYDGPPRAGKTTSLRALGSGMKSALFSPGEEQGRTLYFDWLEYQGGNFEGLPIRCQIVGVPGQEELAERRRALLSEGDAVVFVLDGSPAHLAEAAAHLRELRSFLATLPAPCPALLVQANQRDLPGALPVAVLRQELGLEGTDLIETVATDGVGVREAFVLAVGLALQRVRGLRERGLLASGPGLTDDPQALLLRLGQPRESTAALAGVRPPWLPGAASPGGRVWPALEGREILLAAAGDGQEPGLAPDGSWRLRSGSWSFHSAPGHELARWEEADEELTAWTRHYAPALHRLSPERCVTLADTGAGRWRLWQVVRARESLRSRIVATLRELPRPAARERLRADVGLLARAIPEFRNDPPLPCHPGVIGEAAGRPVYIGLLPPAGWTPPAAELSAPVGDLARHWLRPLLEMWRPADGQLMTAALQEIDETLGGPS